MARIYYVIRNENYPDEDGDKWPDFLPRHMCVEYKFPTHAWKALSKWLKADKDTLKADGWRVRRRFDVDEAAVADVVLDVAPVPGPIRGLIRRLFGRK